MKKYFYLVLMALIATAPLSFVSCGSDDDEDDGFSLTDGSIEINGVTYATTDLMSLEGNWNKDGDNKGTFCITFTNKVGNTIDVWMEQFEFTSSHMPKVGDDFADMSLKQTPLESLFFDDYNMFMDGPFTYYSGSAKVVNINMEKDHMTIKFDNLKTVNGNRTYTFNGIVVVNFNFYRTH